VRVTHKLPIVIIYNIFRWKGRLHFKVYNPLKPIKYGLKTYINADSTNAYCYNLRVYDGIPHTLSETVNNLVVGLEDKFHNLYMDNFYNSVRYTTAQS
jgi:hypothetical protein